MARALPEFMDPRLRGDDSRAYLYIKDFALRILIDLTPLLPGGENGGAKIMVLRLIDQMSKLAPADQFFLLGSRNNLRELTALAAPNIKIINASKLRFALLDWRALPLYLVLLPAFAFSRFFMPGFVRKRLKYAFRSLRQFIKIRSIAKGIQPDVCFYPFTAVGYQSKKSPAVAVVLDIQFHQHPHFFENDNLHERKMNFFQACKKAQKIVCISDFVRNTVIEAAKIAPEKASTIYIRLAQRLQQTKTTTLLEELGVKNNGFLLYPANFWRHKNHLMLLTAFNMYRKLHPESQLKLVCTGANNALKNQLVKTIKQLNLESWISLPGFVSDDLFSSLMSGCKALIFPSLYEGFGMPVLEAMANAKPVLCSNLTSLPEIAGQNALFFDPRKPDQIMMAIKAVDEDSELIKKLSTQGPAQAAEFICEGQMAREYLALFNQVTEVAQ